MAETLFDSNKVMAEKRNSGSPLIATGFHWNR